MHWHGDVNIDRVTPKEADVLRALGVPAGHAVNERTRRAIAAGLDEFRSAAVSSGIFASVSRDEFSKIYEGSGDNETPSPLAEIFPGADELVLFAATLGRPVSERIAALFKAGEYALGGALDAAASEAAELTAGRLIEMVLAEIGRSGRGADGARALSYSPGYCGWNLTGQRALFAALDPELIGITLTESCLMEPVKSISGVIVVGPAEIHEFNNDYDFCTACRTRGCRGRIAGLAHD
jgi:hypothetical protein